VLLPAVPLMLLVGAAVGFLLFLHRTYPLEICLFWDFARIWAWQLVLVAASLSTGHRILAKLVPLGLPPLERLVIGIAVGIVVFAVGMYLGGALGLFGPAFAVALPAVMIVAGLPTALPGLRQAARQWRAQRPADGAHRSAIRPLVHGFGVLALAFLYFQCMTPDSLSYDAQWTHMVVAEDYAREHRIVPFVAETAKCLPHLHSMIFTWGFLVPGFSEPALRWMMCQHIEFTLFLWTLVAAIPAARWLLNRPGLNGAWVVFFLFPGFYVYDSTLGGGSDHVNAFFALPLLLAAVRAREQLSPRTCLVAGAMAGAALHVKYQAVYLVGPVALMLLLRWIAVLISHLRLARDSVNGGARRAATPLWRGPAAFAAGALLVLSPHFLKNLVFYRNPVYPFMSGLFTGSRPILPDAAVLNQHLSITTSWRPPDALTERITSTLRVMFTFSFDPQCSFVGKIPVFGSLFTLLIPVILLRAWRRRRLFLGFLLAQGALLIWAWVYRVDRNLQLLLPWLVAVTAAAIADLWDSGWLARVGVAVLVMAQIAWGCRLMVAGGAERFRSAMELVRGVADAAVAANDRYAGYHRGLRDLGAAVPKQGLLLLHTAHLQLGIDRRTYSDWAGWQYLIDYRKMRTERDLYLRFHEVGITHVAWNNHDFPASKQEDVLFWSFMLHHATWRGTPGGFSLWEMPTMPPLAAPPIRALVLGVRPYDDGLYSIEKLGVIDALPARFKSYPAPDVATPDPALAAAALKSSDALVTVTSLQLAPAGSDELSRCFTCVVNYYSGTSIFVRKTSPECARR